MVISRCSRHGVQALTDQRVHPSLAALRAFEAVGRLGGVRKAAKELMVDHAVVSRHIQALETWVGMQLVTRTGPNCALSDTGAIYHEQIARGLDLINSATSSLMQNNEDLKLRMECSPGLASLWLSDCLGEFIRENRDILVDFRPSDTSPDFRDHHVDIDIRYVTDWTNDDYPKFVRRMEFARPEVFPVASPECVARLPPLRSAEDFLTLPLLHQGVPGGMEMEWRQWLLGHDVRPLDHLPGSFLWQAQLALAAARGGHGVALANMMLVSGDLKAGRLVRVIPRTGGFRPIRFGAYTMIAREDRWNRPAVVRFRRWLQTVVTRSGDLS